MSKVILKKCDNYNEELVEQTLRKAIEKLGGIGNFVKPGQRVLLKPNALQVATPEQAATTHPSIVKAVAKIVKEAGATVLIGDSPGYVFSSPEKVFEATGIQKAAKEAGAEIIEFSKDNIQSIKSPSNNKKVPELNISKVVLEADVIINLAKLKTHGLTLMTGAIKNMYGCITGFNKASYHFLAPHPLSFSEVAVDVYQITKPVLNIVDAIDAMEGNGPSAGTPHHLGAIIISSDGAAADAVGAALIGYHPKDIPTNLAAAKRGLGEIELSKIQIEGSSIEELKAKDFKKAPNAFFYIPRQTPLWLVELIAPLLNRYIWIKPKIIQNKCTQCLTCIRACPVHTIKKQNHMVIVEPKKCIMCFCCHELCEDKAIELKSSLLAKLFRIAQ